MNSDLYCSPMTIMGERNALVCPLVHISGPGGRLCFANQALAYAVMRRRENTIMLRAAGRLQVAICPLAHQMRNAPSTARARRKKAALNRKKETRSSRT